jgi:hypothetical protein
MTLKKMKNYPIFSKHLLVELLTLSSSKAIHFNKGWMTNITISNSPKKNIITALATLTTLATLNIKHQVYKFLQNYKIDYVH